MPPAKGMLNDERLSQLIAATPPLVSEIDPSDNDAKNSPVQACSVDLAVGRIYRPRDPSWTEKLGWAREDLGQWEITLKQGQTAIIRTRETLSLPSDVAGIAFPPVHVSTRGLLMTNAGLVDPGYEGYLHLTIINMGKTDHIIRSGDRLVSVLFFQLVSAAQSDWAARRSADPRVESTFISTAQTRLSRDFLNIDERARAEASKAVTRAALWQSVLPVLISIATAFITVYVYSQQNAAAIARLEGRLGGLGANVNLDNVERRLSALEKQER